MGEKEDTIQGIKKNIVDGKAEATVEFTKKSLNMGNTPLETLAAMTDAMQVVGDLYAEKKYFLPNVLTSANAFDKGFSLVQPKLIESAGSRPKMAKVVIGVCEGDIHDIGKKIVVAMLRGGGFEVFDLGRDIPNSEFVDKAKEVNADICAQSALMSTSVSEMRDFVELCTEEGIRDKVKIMIGGGSATREFGVKIGVDGYGLTSADAVEVAVRLSQ